MKILLVDDNASLRTFAAEVLRDAGHHVVECGEGPAALSKADDFFPDLLVTDFDLPGLDGLGLIHQLRRQRPSLPVLLISSHCSDPALAERRDVACLGKPFRRHQLLTGLQAAQEAAQQASRGTGSRGLGRGWRGLVLAAGIATLALALWLGGSLRPSGPPPLPEPLAGQARRSATLQVITPQGVLAELPGSVSWHPLEGAASYRLTFETVDGRLLLSSITEATEWAVPDELRVLLPPNVAYYWRVEAFSSNNEMLARSAKTRFRVIAPETDRPEASTTGSFP